MRRVKRKHLGLDAFRLRINPEDAPEVNHRAIFDVKNGTFRITKIGVRPGFYSPENLSEAGKQL